MDSDAYALVWVLRSGCTKKDRHHQESDSVFGIIGALILNVFALRLDASEKPAQVIGGVIMHVSTILFLACFGLVYIYALFKLPSSQQELLFSEEAKKMLAEDRRQRAREAK